MANKIIQDIYVVKKSIRMIKKSDVRDGFYVNKKKLPIEKDIDDSDLIDKFPKEEDEDTSTDEYFQNKNHVTKDSLIFLWIICIVSIATLLFLLSSVFATATLTITPRSETVTLNDTYSITADKAVSSSTLHFEVMTVTKDLSKTLETDGEEYIERKATGKAVIYNNSGTSNQRLINNTRLETKEGLTYRIRQSVDIPGIKTIAGVKTPGSVEVEIIADMAGDKYDMKLSDFKGDFTIPGFKGSTKYTTFYARLSSDMTGGYIGNVKKVSDEKLSAGKTELVTSLKEDLIKEVFSKKPEQFILFKDNYYLQCNDATTDFASTEYKISEECSINAVLFNMEELSSFIAKNKIKDFDNSKVDILWNDNNSASLLSTTEKPWNETSLKVRFAGPTQIVWSYDTNAILSSIVGLDKSIISSVIANNKNSLVEIQATIKPMWRNTFPKSESKIKIVDTLRDKTN
jgi:hypothetical protein